MQKKRKKRWREDYQDKVKKLFTSLLTLSLKTVPLTFSGYGNTTPQTTAGRASVIFYGFFGCSIGILFFNLFLERIITLLAYILRGVHVRRLRKRIHQQQVRI